MANSKSHPAGLYLLFFTEMWERFSYYGMRAIFALFLIQGMLMSKGEASSLYGDYTGLVYLSPLVGGYVADRYWGNRRSIVFGGVLMSIGHLLLFSCASLLSMPQLSHILLLLGLFFLIFGNGFFKPNISSMVGDLYEQSDKRKDSAYTLFYMGVNFGAFFSPLVCGTLGETGTPEDFRYGFLAAAIGMVIGTLCFVSRANKYLVTPKGEPVGMPPKKVEAKAEAEAVPSTKSYARLWWIIAGEVVLFALFYLFMMPDITGPFIFSVCITVPIFVLTDPTLNSAERTNIIIIILIAVFVIFFWAAFEQAGASLTFFAEEQTDRVLLSGYEPISSSPYAPYFIIAAVVLVGDALIYCASKVFKFGMSFPGWLASVIFLVTIGFLLANIGEELNTSYFQSLNPIFVLIFAPIMSALWIFLENKGIHISSPTKQAFGMLLLSIGYFVISIGVDGIPAGAKVSMMWIVTLYFILTLGELSLSPIGLSMVNQLSPARFSSLMMSVWYLSTATANKFSGILSALYPEADPETGEVIATSFLGYTIENTHDFFLLFAIMSGVSAVALFGLCRWIDRKVKI